MCAFLEHARTSIRATYKLTARCAGDLSLARKATFDKLARLLCSLYSKARAPGTYAYGYSGYKYAFIEIA